MSKTLQMILSIIAVTIVLFIAMLFMVLRTKVTDISDKKPFTEIVNQTVVLKRKAILVKCMDGQSNENPYVIVENETELMDDAKPRYELPAGTLLNITSAKIFKNGTSGFSHMYVLGTVSAPDRKNLFYFEYQWGQCSNSLDANVKDDWTFPLALWQDSITTEKFYYN